MKITTIRVSAGRTFNHPHEQYSNFRCHVELEAALCTDVTHADSFPDRDFERCVKELQAKAEKLAEEHKQHLLKSVRDLAELTAMQREAVDLEQQLKRSQERLERIRKEHPEVFTQLQLAGAPEPEEGRENFRE